MRVVVDIECNRLKDPDRIWLIVCKDMDSGEYHVFRNVDTDPTDFLEFTPKVRLWVGHNFLGYDAPVLHKLLDWHIPVDNTIDTLVLSKLVDYPRDSHSIEDYGKEFQLEKGDFSDWSRYSSEMEEYCKRDVDICEKIYYKYKKVIDDRKWKPAIDLEQQFQLVCNELHDNGFYFNRDKATNLLGRVQAELENLDKEILIAFPPRLVFVREITPRLTKYGTLNRNDFRWVADGDLSRFNGGPFCLVRWQEFNPSSHKQIVDVLNAAGWKPTDKTKTHVEYLRSRSNRHRNPEDARRYATYGWKVNEENIASLPARAPAPARTLAKRILYEARRRTLVEWLGLVDTDSRIHGEYHGIGTWTHRTATTRPNTQNIPNEKDDQGRLKLLGGELRALWCAPRGRLLVGCDAEGIQLRGFAHYINDVEFTREVCDGDPHSLNQRILGDICKDRQASKRFIYALLLGAGLGKLAEILECSKEEAERGLHRIMERYSGFLELKENVFPADIRRGWFRAVDGRKVTIPSVRDKPHLVMSGYLQSFEAIVMKKATLKWKQWLQENKTDHIIVDLVHDEWQTECRNNMDDAIRIGNAQCEALKQTGIDLGLNVPLAGSFYNKKKNDYTIGTNWRVTH